MVWKLEREKSKRRVHGGKGAGGEIVRDFLTKLHSNYFRAVRFTEQKIPRYGFAWLAPGRQTSTRVRPPQFQVPPLPRTVESPYDSTVAPARGCRATLYLARVDDTMVAPVHAGDVVGSCDEGLLCYLCYSCCDMVARRRHQDDTQLT